MQVIQRMERWTDEERQYIKDHYLEMSDEELAQKLKRKTSGVKNQRQAMLLQRPYVYRNTKRKYDKPTFEQLQWMFDERGYDLLSTEDEYINQSSKMRYICRKHKDEGEQQISVYHFKEGKGCYYCGRERTEAAHISKVNSEEDKLLCTIKGFEYITTKKERNYYVIYFICNKHRELGIQSMRRGNMNRENVQGCQYCIHKNLPDWYFKKQIETMYPHLIVESEYLGMNKYIKCYCKIHDEHFENLAKEVYYYGRGCTGCTYEKMASHQRLTKDEIIEKAYQYNPNAEILNLSTYENMYTKLLVKCKKCGFIWWASLADLHNQSGHCPSCDHISGKSIGEMKIISELENMHITHSSQYRIKECKDKRTLPFDDSILDKNMNLLGLIEYQGEQHYYPIEYFGGEEGFKDRIKKDKIKKEYCEKNNIPLLIIPYWEFKNIRTLLEDFIQQII